MHPCFQTDISTNLFRTSHNKIKKPGQLCCVETALYITRNAAELPPAASESLFFLVCHLTVLSTAEIVQHWWQLQGVYEIGGMLQKGENWSTQEKTLFQCHFVHTNHTLYEYIMKLYILFIHIILTLTGLSPNPGHLTTQLSCFILQKIWTNCEVHHASCSMGCRGRTARVWSYQLSVYCYG
jgi:hypothetical protein